MKNNLRHSFAEGTAQPIQTPDFTGGHEKSVVSAIMLIDGKIPVFRRSKGDDVWYDLPGGKPERIDPNDPHSRFETIFEAIIREAYEELGIKVCVNHQLVVDSMPHPRIEGATKTFIHCRHLSGEPYNRLPDEHDALLLLQPPHAVQLLGARISPVAATAMFDLGRAPANQTLEPLAALKPPVFGS